MKPFPVDAIMLIASPKGKECREQMEGVYYEKCRECGCEIACDTFSLRRCEEYARRLNKPVKYACLPCSEMYMMPHTGKSVIEDHRKHLKGTIDQWRM